MSAIDISRLDPAKFVDLDLGSDRMRQGALAGILAGWAQSPPFYVENFGIPQVVVGRYADVKAVFLDDRNFTCNPPRLPGYERLDFFNGIVTVAQMDGAEHDRVRRLMNPPFSPAALAKVETAIRTIVAAMLDEVETLGGPFDCMNDFANHLVIRILMDGLLGMSPEQQAAFIRMNRAFSLTVNLGPGEPRPAEYLEAEQAVGRVMMELIAERRAQPREHDFVSALVAHHDAGRLSLAELTANIFGILAAGQGTTAISTGAMLMNLCKHRDQFDQVIADPALIPQTVEESLRYQGPGFFGFPHFATQDCEVGGTLILKDMPVHVSQQAACFDPVEYPDPLRFDIHRNPRNILTFGTGTHHCLGNRLGRKVLAVVLEQVCRRFPRLRLQDPDYVPRYEGMFSELKPASIPMHTGQ